MACKVVNDGFPGGIPRINFVVWLAEDERSDFDEPRRHATWNARQHRHKDNP